MIAGLSAAALIGSLYLVAVAAELAPPFGCGGKAECDALVSSRWSRWLGVPVALPALIVYALCLAGAVLLWRARGSKQRRTWQWTTASGALALAGAVWSVIVPLFFQAGWCAPCLATSLAGGAAGALLVSFARPAPEARPQRAASPLWAAGAGIAALIALWLGQAALAPVEHTPARSENEAVATAATPQASARDAAPPEPPVKLIGLHLGRFVLNGNDQPFWGTDGATFAGVLLVDYTDRNTRKMRPVYEHVIERYHGALVLLLVPAPLDSSCNRHVKVTLPANENACRYAELAFAVWHAKRDAFHPFDDFMYAQDAPPSLEQARARAEALVGKEALARALEDDWVATQLQKGTDILQVNEEKGVEHVLPQLMLGPIVLRGMTKFDTLADVLDEYTQKTPPGSSKVLGAMSGGSPPPAPPP